MSSGGIRPRAGRPKGSPNKATAEIKLIARKYTKAAMVELARLSTGAESEQARVAAIRELLDRGFGKPAQALTGADGGAIKQEVTLVTGVPEPASDD